MNPELYAFVKSALERGLARAEIRDALLKAGWRQDEVEKTLSSFAQVPFPLPVPKPKPYLMAREAFLYLVSFISLYIWVFSFGALLFSFIDLWFPDIARGYYYGDFTGGGMRVAISSLIVAFPLYVFLMRQLQKGAKADPERRESRVRKWLSYLTLVVASSVLIGDLISVIFNLLGGELTIRFLLKALTVFVITGALFGYYLSDLQEEKEKQ